tara:strand:+ start:6362 stop:6757 length:396 start_codon:yes stop_codon:yes gene_type:complete
MFISYLIKFKWVFAVLSAVSSLYAIGSYYESKGYNRAKIEFQAKATEEIHKATKEALLKVREMTQKALDDQQVIYDSELKRVEQEQVVRIKTKKVTEYVDRIKIRNECAVISDDVISVLNESVNNSNVASN